MTYDEDNGRFLLELLEPPFDQAYTNHLEFDKETGIPIPVYDGDALMQIYVSQGYTIEEAEMELNSFEETEIRIVWDATSFMIPDRPTFTLIQGNKKDLH
jgi:hypothetical protein